MLPESRRVDVAAVVRAAKRLEDAGGGLEHCLRTRDGLEQDPELVAAESRRRVAGAQAARQSVADLLEDVVADGVALRVVEGLELVQVDEHHRHPRGFVAVPQEGVLDPVIEERAVGQACERVVERAVAQLLLESLASFDVPRGDDDAAHLRIVDEVGGDGLEVAVGAVGVAHPPLGLLGLAGGFVGHRAQEGGHRRRVVRVDPVGQALSPASVAVAAEDGLHQSGDRAQHPLLVDDGDEVRGVLDDRLEAIVLLLGEALKLESVLDPAPSLLGEDREEAGQRKHEGDKPRMVPTRERGEQTHRHEAGVSDVEPQEPTQLLPSAEPESDP